MPVLGGKRLESCVGILLRLGEAPSLHMPIPCLIILMAGNGVLHKLDFLPLLACLPSQESDMTFEQALSSVGGWMKRSIGQMHSSPAHDCDVRARIRIAWMPRHCYDFQCVVITSVIPSRACRWVGMQVS